MTHSVALIVQSQNRELAETWVRVLRRQVQSCDGIRTYQFVEGGVGAALERLVLIPNKRLGLLQ